MQTTAAFNIDGQGLADANFYSRSMIRGTVNINAGGTFGICAFFRCPA